MKLSISNLHDEIGKKIDELADKYSSIPSNKISEQDRNIGTRQGLLMAKKIIRIVVQAIETQNDTSSVEVQP